MRRVRGLLGERERAFPSRVSFEVERSRCPHSRERLGFVWDLRLQSFEREAWIKHVLCKANARDFQAYLNERLNDDG